MSKTMIAVVSTLALAQGALFTENPEHQRFLWSEFKNEYNKVIYFFPFWFPERKTNF